MCFIKNIEIPKNKNKNLGARGSSRQILAETTSIAQSQHVDGRLLKLVPLLDGVCCVNVLNSDVWKERCLFARTMEIRIKNNIKTSVNIKSADVCGRSLAQNCGLIYSVHFQNTDCCKLFSKPHAKLFESCALHLTVVRKTMSPEESPCSWCSPSDIKCSSHRGTTPSTRTSPSSRPLRAPTTASRRAPFTYSRITPTKCGASSSRQAVASWPAPRPTALSSYGDSHSLSTHRRHPHHLEVRRSLSARGPMFPIPGLQVMPATTKAHPVLPVVKKITSELSVPQIHRRRHCHLPSDPIHTPIRSQVLHPARYHTIATRSIKMCRCKPLRTAARRPQSRLRHTVAAN